MAGSSCAVAGGGDEVVPLGVEVLGGSGGTDEGKKRGRESEDDQVLQRSHATTEERVRKQKSQYLVGTFKAWRNVRQRCAHAWHTWRASFPCFLCSRITM